MQTTPTKPDPVALASEAVALIRCTFDDLANPSRANNLSAYTPEGLAHMRKVIIPRLQNTLKLCQLEAGDKREPGEEFIAPISEETLRKMRTCAPLLPEPGGEVAIQLLDHIDYRARHERADPVTVAATVIVGIIVDQHPSLIKLLTSAIDGRASGRGANAIATMIGVAILRTAGIR